MVSPRLRSLAALLLAAAAAAGYTYRPVSVSFVPPLSTNGIDGGNVATRFSLNVIGGYTGRLDGFELGSCFNIIRSDVTGCQLSGAMNIVGGELTGLQAAGAINIVGGGYKETFVHARSTRRRGRMTGVQLAPVNITAADAAGAQVGAANIAARGLDGLQLGAANITGDHVTVQVGAANVAASGAEVQVGAANISASGRVTGSGLSYVPGVMNRVQVGAANIADGPSDVQVGTVNICRSARRLQLGVVNIADDADVAIGIVSIVRHGRFNVDVWASDAALLNIGMKTGSKYVYNVVGIGVKPAGTSSRLHGMYGLGGHIPRNRFFVDIDAVAGAVSDGSDLFSFTGTSLLSQLRVTGGWQVLPMLAVTVGPAVSVFVSDREDGSLVPLYDAFIYHARSGRTHVRIWPGFTVGLQLL